MTKLALLGHLATGNDADTGSDIGGTLGNADVISDVGASRAVLARARD
jgi:hypothetical protein